MSQKLLTDSKIAKIISRNFINKLLNQMKIVTKYLIIKEISQQLLTKIFLLRKIIFKLL